MPYNNDCTIKWSFLVNINNAKAMFYSQPKGYFTAQHGSNLALR